ncbi:hypothetical protein ACFL6M_04425 [Candidatus Eisenbacteria bacterium]|uniref:Uncharacterized protein n=1 Tax=Eiseniibacteriota bacterium TaxID=2212470 RepID=A0ABV6YKG6_UNCEI
MGCHLIRRQTLINQQKWAEAAAHHVEALVLDASEAQGLGRLARLLAACPETSVRDGHSWDVFLSAPDCASKTA